MTEEEPIHLYSYTAEQAIEDGILIEIAPELSKKAGYRWPVRITQGVSSLATPTEQEQQQGQNLTGRLWDILWVAKAMISNADPRDRIIPFDMTLGKRMARLWACLDTTSGPAIHIITPEEY